MIIIMDQKATELHSDDYFNYCCSHQYHHQHHKRGTETSLQDGRKYCTLKRQTELCGREGTVPCACRKVFRQHMWEW